MTAAGPPRILIVEDDDPIRSLLVKAIGRRSPLVVDSASDGIEAVEKLGAASYSVVVLDLMMPRMNGFELLDHLILQAKAPRPVIFVMTAFDQTQGRELDSRLVHGIIRKPFDLDTVTDMISDCALLHHHTYTEPVSDSPRPQAVC